MLDFREWGTHRLVRQGPMPSKSLESGGGVRWLSQKEPRQLWYNAVCNKNNEGGKYKSCRVLKREPTPLKDAC